MYGEREVITGNLDYLIGMDQAQYPEYNTRSRAVIGEEVIIRCWRYCRGDG